VPRANRARASTLPRRSFLAAAGLLAAGAALEAYGPDQWRVFRPRARTGRDTSRPFAVATDGAVHLVAAPDVVDPGGRSARTWTFNGSLPGPELRVRASQVLRVDFDNRLPAPTSIHWHGIAIRNDMDSVPGFTQRAIAPGARFLYEFTTPNPGTYFYHPHAGVQLDRGLYGVLIVEDPAEPGRYDHEAVVVLDDWTDGVGETPDRILARLQANGMDHAGMPGMDHGMAGMDHEWPAWIMEAACQTRPSRPLRWATTPATSAIRCTWSTAARLDRRRPCPRGQATGYGCASSTPLPTPRSGWPSAATG
jgi:multicopper oxidase